MPGSRDSRSSVMTGLILIVLGVLFILGNLDIVGVGEILVTWWPAILIVIALYNLMTPRGRRSLGPYILLGIGVVFLLIQLDYFDWDILSYIWPLALILIGLRIMFGSRLTRAFGAPGAAEEMDTISATAFMGGAEHTVTSRQFRGGQLSAICGGVDLDLRQAQLVPGQVVLNVTVLCGGAEIIVPTGWQVVMKGTPILGGLENKTTAPPEGAAPTLRIDAFCCCGAVEVHN